MQGYREPFIGWFAQRRAAQERRFACSPLEWLRSAMLAVQPIFQGCVPALGGISELLGLL